MKCYQRAQQIMHERLSTEEVYPAGFFIRDRRLSLHRFVPRLPYQKSKLENSLLPLPC